MSRQENRCADIYAFQDTDQNQNQRRHADIYLRMPEISESEPQAKTVEKISDSPSGAADELSMWRYSLSKRLYFICKRKNVG